MQDETGPKTFAGKIESVDGRKDTHKVQTVFQRRFALFVPLCSLVVLRDAGADCRRCERQIDDALLRW